MNIFELIIFLLALYGGYKFSCLFAPYGIVAMVIAFVIAMLFEIGLLWLFLKSFKKSPPYPTCKKCGENNYKLVSYDKKGGLSTCLKCNQKYYYSYKERKIYEVYNDEYIPYMIISKDNKWVLDDNTKPSSHKHPSNYT